MSKRIGSVIILFLIFGRRVAFEFLDTGFEPVEALEACDHAAPDRRLLERNPAGVYAGLGYRMTHHRGAEEDDVVTDGEMAANGDLAGDLAALADRGTARDSRQRGNGRVSTNADVVGDHDE